MPDDLKQRIREIEESARKVDKLAMTLAVKTGERKLAKEDWEAAVERHMELCRHWEDSEEVADRPLVKAIEARAGDVAEDTFAALRSVGHTDEQARRAVEHALASGKVFGSVNDMIDFIYNVMESPDDAEDEAEEDRLDALEDAEEEEDELSGTDLVTSRPGAPFHEEPETKARRRRKAKA